MPPDRGLKKGKKEDEQPTSGEVGGKPRKNIQKIIQKKSERAKDRSKM